MTNYVLDTNILSLIIKQNRQLVLRFDALATPENLFIGCPVVWYEIRRGLLVRDAKLQMKHLVNLFSSFDWQDYTPDDWKLASELWAKRTAAGLPIADADLLIAVFTVNRNAVLVTNNEKDFVDLGVTVENWAAG